MKKHLIIVGVLSCARAVFGQGTEVHFSPGEECESCLVKAVEGAKKSIDAAVYSITNSKISDALIQAKNRGVQVRVLTDRQNAPGLGSQVLRLLRNGIDVRVHSVHQKEHNKFAIVDGATALTGSYNWTNSATDRNSENLTQLTEKKPVKQFHERFKELWEMNSAEKSQEHLKNAFGTAYEEAMSDAALSQQKVGAKSLLWTWLRKLYRRIRPLPEHIQFLETADRRKTEILPQLNKLEKRMDSVGKEAEELVEQEKKIFDSHPQTMAEKRRAAHRISQIRRRVASLETQMSVLSRQVNPLRALIHMHDLRRLHVDAMDVMPSDIELTDQAILAESVIEEVNELDGMARTTEEALRPFGTQSDEEKAIMAEFEAPDPKNTKSERAHVSSAGCKAGSKALAGLRE